MSTITAILEPDADGTLHLPLPTDLRQGKIQVTATLEALDSDFQRLPVASPEMLIVRRKALKKLRDLSALRGIGDPEAWQRDIRQDQPLPGRD